jgi:hypothetical protein
MSALLSWRISELRAEMMPVLGFTISVVTQFEMPLSPQENFNLLCHQVPFPR